MGLGAFINGAVSVISSCIGTVGKVIGDFAASIITRIPPLDIPKTLEIIRLIANVAELIADLLGVTERGESAEELGAKAMAGDKKMDDFKSTDEYLEYLRKEVRLDQQKQNEMTSEERIASAAVGIAILSRGIEEKKDILIPSDFWVEVGKQNMKGEEVRTYLDNFKSGGFSELKLADFLKGNLPMTELRLMGTVVEQTLRKLNPELSDDAIQEKLSEMMHISRG